MDDPSGNGFIENLHAPLDDPQLKCFKYKRTSEQNKLLGFEADDDDDEEEEEKAVGIVFPFPVFSIAFTLSHTLFRKRPSRIPCQCSMWSAPIVIPTALQT